MPATRCSPSWRRAPEWQSRTPSSWPGAWTESGAFRACRDALYAIGEPLLARAQQAGRVRAEVTIDDVLRFFLGVTSAPVSSRRQRDRFLAMAIAGLAA